MLINLHHQPLNQQSQPINLTISERLPSHFLAGCAVSIQFKLKKERGYYLLDLWLSTELKLCCQRCLENFNHAYSSQTTIALCSSEDLAERLMADYDCITLAGDSVDLTELITDELFLYAPEFHPNKEECNQLVNKHLQQ